MCVRCVRVSSCCVSRSVDDIASQLELHSTAASPVHLPHLKLFFTCFLRRLGWPQNRCGASRTCNSSQSALACGYPHLCPFSCRSCTCTAPSQRTCEGRMCVVQYLGRSSRLHAHRPCFLASPTAGVTAAPGTKTPLCCICLCAKRPILCTCRCCWIAAESVKLKTPSQ